jgi:hypothetical protein
MGVCQAPGSVFFGGGRMAFFPNTPFPRKTTRPNRPPCQTKKAVPAIKPVLGSFKNSDRTAKRPAIFQMNVFVVFSARNAEYAGCLKT